MLSLLALLLVAVFGFPITLLIAPRVRFLERLALAYGLGWGAVTLGMFYLSVLGIPFSLPNIAALLVVVTLSLGWLVRKTADVSSYLAAASAPRDLLRRMKRPSLPETVVLSAIVFCLLAALLIAAYWPVHTWDALAVYDVRARMFADALSIKEASLQMPHVPPLTSLAHSWLYLLGGEGQNARLIYPLFSASLVVVFYYSLREQCSALCSLIFALLLVTAPQFLYFSSVAYSNMPYAFYQATAVLCLYRWLSLHKQGYLALSALLFGLGSWTRPATEPYLIAILAVLAVYCLGKRRCIAVAGFVALFLTVAIPWELYVRYGLSRAQVFGSLESEASIAYGLIRTGLNWVQIGKAFDLVRLAWNLALGLIWPFFLGAVLLNLKNLKQHGWLLLIIASQAAVFVAGVCGFATVIYPDNPRGLYAVVTSSGTRLLLFLVPLLLYYAAITKPVKDLFEVGLSVVAQIRLPADRQP
ncbi:MAG: glycosyltransferase family 39 protein [Anaerolineae bacterium]